MQISVWDDTAQRRAPEGQVHGRHLGLHLAYLWAFPGICGHIGVPEHMPAYGHLGWPHAVMKNMGISGGKHTHIPTPTAHHGHYRRRFTLSEKTLCFVCSNLGLPTTILSFLLLHIFEGVRFFSLEMCSNLWLSGDRFGRLCSPQLFQNNQLPSTIWGRWPILLSSSYQLTVFHKHLCPPNQPQTTLLIQQ